MKTELYFELNDSSGRRITEDQWKTFEDSILVNLHLEYTITNSYWQHNSKAIKPSQPIKIVTFVYCNDKSIDKTIEMIRDNYRTRFHLTSLLRIDSRIVYRYN